MSAEAKEAILETCAARLVESGNYRVLRRLKGFDWSTNAQEGEKKYKGLYVDVETTGLDLDKDEVIELCAWPFLFTHDGRIVDFAEPLHYYRQPSIPITEEITKITKITAEMVAGKSIDVPKLEEWVGKTDLIVAHHAGFDRPMLERISPTFAAKCWGCSMSQVPWQEHGIAGKRLEYVLAALGYYYDAHNAQADCHAGMFALNAKVGDSTALSHVLKASREASWHVWAVKAAFDHKDKLKARGYFWNGGEDGRDKAWHREIPAAARAEEEAWLERVIYKRIGVARFDKVTAFERFTKRG